MDNINTAAAAQLVLSQVFGDGHPGSVAGLARLSAAYQLLKAAGINPRDKAAVTAAAKGGK